MRSVLVTGASQGLGKALSEELVQRGYKVFATARNPQNILVEGVFRKLPLDLTDAKSISSLLKEIDSLDILINNAGISLAGPVEAVPTNAVREVFETNLFGPLQLVQGIVPLMRSKESGIIVNISSAASQFAPPYGGIYAASKAALELISEELRFELVHFGIEVMVIQCGAIDTEIAEHQKRFTLLQYQKLGKQLEEGYKHYKLRNNRPAPLTVAKEILDALEQENAPFKTPVGDDARHLLNLRKQMSDAQWEKESPFTKHLDW